MRDFESFVFSMCGYIGMQEGRGRGGEVTADDGSLTFMVR